MKGSNSFKIVIGDGWRATAYAGFAADSFGRPEKFDAAQARGVLDMVVDGTSLVSRPDEDSVFFLMRDFLTAVERLSTGDGTARVSFYESPHELVLQRISDQIYITFYRGGAQPEVFVKDQMIPFLRFLEGVLASASDLTAQAMDSDPSAADDPLVSWIKETASRIASLPKEATRARENGSAKMIRIGVESTRWKQSRNDRGFSFGFKFLVTSTDLLAPGRPIGNDLNALLFEGQYVVHARERRRILGKGFLFLQTEKLLASVRKLLAAWEEGRPTTVRLISEGLVVGVRLGVDDSLAITLLNPDDEDSILVINDLTPWEYADAVLGAAREVRRLVVDQSSRQRRNIRLESFSREIRTLAVWAKEQRRGAVINRDVDQYRTVAANRRAEGAKTERIGEASRLAFTERWRIEAEGLDLGGTMLCGTMGLISARRFMLGVDVETGAVAWQRETERSESVMRVAGRDGLVRVFPSGQVEMLDLATGVARWTTHLAARSGGSPVILVVDHGPVPGIVIVAEEEKKLVALDLRTGEPRWKFTSPRGGRFAFRRYGRLLYVASNDSHLSAVDLEDGSLVWRFPERTKFNLPPAAEGDIIVVPGGRYGKQEGKLFGLNAYSGEVRWEHSLNGGALTSPITAASAALVPVRSGGKNDLAAVDINTGEDLWRISCDGWAESCALMALDDCFIVNAAGGVMRSFHARTGEEIWHTVLGPACSDDVPINLRITLRSGVLFVPADTVYVVRPDNGHVIHSLGGDPPVPDLLQVDPNCAIFMAEESGHIAMYDLARRLSVVEGGA